MKVTQKLKTIAVMLNQKKHIVVRAKTIINTPNVAIKNLNIIIINF